MNRLRIFALVVVLFFPILFLSCSSTQKGDDSSSGSTGIDSDANQAASLAVVSVVMHIETGQRPDVDSLISAFEKLGSAGIPVSFGADYEWLTGESRASEVLQAVVDNGGTLDIHWHESLINNRADNANAILELGFEPSYVASGYTADDEDELNSLIVPNQAGVSWQAEYKWGLAEPGHVSNDTSWGITRDEGSIPQIGGGANSIASAINMVKQVENGDYPHMLLTCSINLQPLTLTVVGGTDNVDDIIDFKTVADGAGALLLTLQAVGELADTSYPGQDSRVEGVSDK